MKTLYRAIGKYKYNGQWNDIAPECQYFHAYPNTKTWVLKKKIARHRKLAKGQESYIKFNRNIIKEVKGANNDKI